MDAVLGAKCAMGKKKYMYMRQMNFVDMSSEMPGIWEWYDAMNMGTGHITGGMAKYTYRMRRRYVICN